MLSGVNVAYYVDFVISIAADCLRRESGVGTRRGFVGSIESANEAL
jgi:hypothetical protein